MTKRTGELTHTQPNGNDIKHKATKVKLVTQRHEKRANFFFFFFFFHLSSSEKESESFSEALGDTIIACSPDEAANAKAAPFSLTLILRSTMEGSTKEEEKQPAGEVPVTVAEAAEDVALHSDELQEARHASSSGTP